MNTLPNVLELSPADMSEYRFELAYSVNSTGDRILRRNNVANQQCRTVFVKFASSKNRDIVIKEFKSRKPTGIYVNEEFSPRVLQKRKDLLPEMTKNAEKEKILYDKLIVREA